MTMVYRVYVEKREGFDVEAKALADPNWQNIRYYNDAFRKDIGSD